MQWLIHASFLLIFMHLLVSHNNYLISRSLKMVNEYILFYVLDYTIKVTTRWLLYIYELFQRRWGDVCVCVCVCLCACLFSGWDGGWETVIYSTWMGLDGVKVIPPNPFIKLLINPSRKLRKRVILNVGYYPTFAG